MGMILGIGDKIADLVEGIFAFLPKLIYFIVACALSLIDVFQLAFRKLAGLDNIIIDGAITKGDPIYSIIVDSIFNGKYPVFRTAFWALIILGVFMLLIATVIQVIRVEYTEKNSKSEIIKNFFKALISFAIVPIACFFGMYLSNGLIRIVDRATAAPQTEIAYADTYFKQWEKTDVSGNTSDTRVHYASYDIFGFHIPTSSETFSGMVFRTCAYSSNRVRDSLDFYNNVFKKISANNNYDEGYPIYFDKVSSQEDGATLIDTAFSISAQTKNTLILNSDLLDGYATDYFHEVFGKYTINSFSRYNASLVYYFYNLWTFNYIIAFIALIILGKTFYNLTINLMCRVFEVAGLFLISPVSISLMPFDNGEGLKKWRGAFVGKFTGIILMVGTFNLVTPLMTIVQGIKFVNFPVIDSIIQTFFLIAAFMSIQSLNATIAEILGVGDALKDSDKNAKALNGNLTSGLRAATSTAALAGAVGVGAAKVPFKLAGAGVRAGQAIGDHRLRKRISDSVKNRQINPDDYQNKFFQTEEGFEKFFNSKNKNLMEENPEAYDNFLRNEIFTKNGEFDDIGYEYFKNGDYSFGQFSDEDQQKFKNFFAASDNYSMLDDEAKKNMAFNDFYKSYSDAENGAKLRQKLFEDSEYRQNKQAKLDAKKERAERWANNRFVKIGSSAIKGWKYIGKEFSSDMKKVANSKYVKGITNKTMNVANEFGQNIPNPTKGMGDAIAQGLTGKTIKDLAAKRKENKEKKDDKKD